MTSLSAAPGAASVSGWMAFCQAIAAAKGVGQAPVTPNPIQKGTIRDANHGR
jgi:hypothetical protein